MPANAPVASTTAAGPSAGARPGTAALVPGSGSGKPRSGTTIVSLFAAAVILAVIGIASNAASPQLGSPGSSEPGSSEPGSAGWLYLADYHPGDCLSTSYPLGSTDPWPDPQFAVPCTQPHAFEVVYANGNFWPTSEAYPGQSELALQADGQCMSAFYAYIGGSDGISPYSYTYQEPASSDDWANGDRDLTCVAFEPDPASGGGELMITQSIKGTGQ
jgi:hypothetical protein